MLRHILLILALTANLPTLSVGQSWNETAATAYLQQQTTTDPWIALGLAGLGQTHSLVAPPAIVTGNPNSFLAVAKAVVALRALGLTTNQFDRDLMAELAAAPAITNTFNTELWRLIAQLAINQPLTPAQVAMIVGAQDAETGGWRIDADNIPDADTTSLALMILGQANGDANVIQRGLEFLATRRSESGIGFSNQFPTPNSASTAWAIMACWIVDPNNALVAPGITFLTSCQKSNGSFALNPASSGNALYTAYAVLALRHEAFPVSRRAFGDFDNSNWVDLSDFLFLLDHWQEPVRGSSIGLADFLTLLDQWQTGGGA